MPERRPATTTAPLVRLSHLDALESEAIHIMREVAAELERPVLLFSGGKDSIVLLRLAEKAFRPGRFPFPLMHVDTGHNFPEAIEFRDRRVAELGERLVIASVQESIDKGRVVEQTGPRASRNQLQTTTLLDAMAEHGFDAAIGGARRDEERSRAKERIFSFRDDFGQWNPRAQRPELWNLYNGRIRKGEQVRVFPISNWTELDVWQYVAREQLELPAIYFSHQREVFERDGMLYAASEFVERYPHEEPFSEWVRFRTVGDMSCTGGVRSTAATIAGGRARDRRDERDGARRDPGRRQGERGRDGGQEACRLLLAAPSAQPEATPSSCASSRAARSTTASRRSSGACSTTRSRSCPISSSTSRRRASAAATATSTWRSSPTGSEPSGSRGSRSTSPTAPSSPRRAASSSQTRPGTSSTRATWSPAPRPPTSRSSCSTPARA